MRLDKYICSCTDYTRSKVKKLIKKGIIVNEFLVRNADYKVNEKEDIVKIGEKVLNYKKYIYLMLNKESGVITATFDKKEKVVLDYIDEKEKIFSPFPVGRLDKDTEGLILLTNDGILAHNILSPKKDIKKKYYVEVNGELTSNHVEIFEKGIKLKDFKCKSAKLEIIRSDKHESKAYITISEGKFHQIKRMINSIRLNVTYLKRISIGTLVLDKNLALGKYRHLNEIELKKLKEEAIIYGN